MSAIFGMVHMDGQPVRREAIEAMRHALEHRGPEGSAVWCRGAVALGHQMMHITPESLHEHLPLHHAKADLTITADARIDNREELFQALGTPHQERPYIPDSGLILRAYEKWQEDCPAHLVGNFAFAIWDGKQQQLFCANDHLGLCPIIYYHCQHHLIFASEAKAILAVPGVPHILNEKKLAALPFLASVFLEAESTFFDGLSILPKATRMTVRAQGIQKHPYWVPSPAIHSPCKTEAAYLEAFREVVGQAVGARLRSAFPVAAQLSGGLDSSAVVAVAAPLLEARGQRLITLSAVLPEDAPATEREERFYIEQFRGWGNLHQVYITDPWRGPFDDLDRLVWGAESPNSHSRHFLYTAFVEAARAQHARVMLDGLGGELGPTFYGDGYLAECLLRGRWLRLLRNLHGLAQREHRSWRQVFKREVLRAILPATVLQRLGDKLRYNLQQWLDQCPLQRAFVTSRVGADIPKLMDAARQLSKPYANHRLNQCRGMALRRSVHWGAFVGYENVQITSPFLDKRVLEFCLAAPGHLKMRNGFKRYFVRAGLDQILPPAIQWRTTKLPASPDYHLRYNRQRQQALDFLATIAPNDPVRTVVDIDKVRAMAQHHMTGHSDNTPENFAAMHSVPKGLMLIHFLRQFNAYQA
jgi:asparagine synthase (glutamine-hydrolysing)